MKSSTTVWRCAVQPNPSFKSGPATAGSVSLARGLRCLPPRSALTRTLGHAINAICARQHGSPQAARLGALRLPLAARAGHSGAAPSFGLQHRRPNSLSPRSTAPSAASGPGKGAGICLWHSNCPGPRLSLGPCAAWPNTSFKSGPATAGTVRLACGFPSIFTVQPYSACLRGPL
jgi:hypothetical protein